MCRQDLLDQGLLSKTKAWLFGTIRSRSCLGGLWRSLIHLIVRGDQDLG